MNASTFVGTRIPVQLVKITENVPHPTRGVINVEFLILKKGDKVTIFEASNDLLWYRGEHKLKVGWFPVKSCKPVKDKPPEVKFLIDEKVRLEREAKNAPIEHKVEVIKSIEPKEKEGSKIDKEAEKKEKRRREKERRN